MNNDEANYKLTGIAVSPGIIIGKARLVDRSKVKIFYQYLIHEEQINREVERFKEAVETTKNQIVTLKNRMPDQIKKHAFILDTHLMILEDSMLHDATIDTIINEKTNAEWALKKSIQNIKKLFDQIDDEYIRERFSDVENAAERILRNLAGKELEDIYEIDERVIIVAHDLSPVDTSGMNVAKIMGFITDVGGRTSHSAIIAHSLKIPAVVGLESVTRRVQDGTLLIVDGNRGEVIIDPDDETIIQYQERQLQHEKYQSSIVRIGHLPAETVDGHKITVEANIEFLEEVALAKEHGAEGIGLYRTEYLYLRSKGIPEEEELFEDYKQVAENMAPNPVTIRTLDMEGNKFPTMALKGEVNPALGLRAIRFCLKEPDIFRSQLRAILRASAHGKIRLMFPMISGLQEIHDSQKILHQAMEALDRKRIPYDRDIEVGIMIEVPSAVAVADILAKHVDFFSIGTNDLIQYALAIDRVNEHVAFMYKPFHPAILRLIQQSVRAAHKAGIQVSMCGEMAADPLCAFVLLGLDVEGLSMNSGGIPVIKKIIRSISIKESKAALEQIFRLETAQEVRDYVSTRVSALLPDFEEKNFPMSA